MTQEQDLQLKLDNLRAELAELEKRAGISEKVEDANLGPLLPDREASSQQYWDDTEDYARHKVRRLYFEEVADVELRKAMIAKRRECDSAHDVFVKTELHNARRELNKAKQRSQRLPWLYAGFAAAACVAVGAWFFQLYGAIAGALVGFFAGQGVIASARRERDEAVRSAQSEVDSTLQVMRENKLSPDWFNRSEQSTGERDKEFDYESVIANRAEAIRSGAMKPDDDD